MLGQAKHPRAIIALIVFMVVAIGAVAVFEAQGGFVPSSVDSTAQIQTDVSAHFSEITTMNATAIAQEYASDARVQFVSQGANNSYSGVSGVSRGFQADVFPYFAVPKFSDFNSTVKLDGKTATVESTFAISGYDSDDVPQTAQVTAHIVYQLQGQNWLITFESWNLVFPPGSTIENNGGE